MKHIEVILPLPLPGTFTYRVSPLLHPNLQVGCRVIVQFGKRKIYTGLVASITSDAPANIIPKEIIDLIDESPVVTDIQLSFFEWMSRYYMCTIGEVMNAALPAGLKISSESLVSINPEIEVEELDLTEKEKVIINHLISGDLKIQDVSKILEIKSPYAHIKSLKDKKAIQVFELVKDKYSPKTETRVRLTTTFENEKALDALLLALNKRKKQQDLVVKYLEHVPVLDNKELNFNGISKKHLLELGVSTSALNSLMKNKVFETFDKVVSRLPAIEPDNKFFPRLSENQALAKKEILNLFEQKSTVLLRGVTGSGKTEIYISLIQDIIDNGGQVLYLLPEIALTTQIIKRLSKVFGSTFGVFHSKYSDNERVEVWQKVYTGEYKFVVGVRSSIFLPFTDLSLIIVDEEHETSFKQYDPAPRYHARDAALYLASVCHAKTLLGTATPSLETYQNVLDGKYGYVALTERFNKVSSPKIEFANLIRERKTKKMNGNFSSVLVDAIEKVIQNNKQVILFQNRRGYAPYVSCDGCGYVPTCPHCDVSLTFHNYQNLLVCHYCGYKSEMIHSCIRCQSEEIKTMSYGTEKIEEELQEIFPDVRIKRMDLDTTRSKYSYQKIIDAFEEGEIDVLIGTQMVSKGLDFDNVELVGVFDADRMIHFPDFRSHERSYQLLHQVSGRAGRKSNTGKVIIQTNDPDQLILQYVKNQNFDLFFQNEVTERKRFQYPPFNRLIRVTIKDYDKQIAADASQFFSKEIRNTLGDMRVIGPVEPMIGKLRNEYLYLITIKIEKQGVNLPAIKEFLLNSRNILTNHRLFKSVRVVFDVDPI